VICGSTARIFASGRFVLSEHLKRILNWESEAPPKHFYLKWMKSYLRWNNDWYGSHAARYLPVVRFLKKFDQPKKFSILEVGSADRGIAQFLDRTVVTADLAFDLENLRRAGKRNIPIKSRIEHLPFKSHSFDIVLTMDLFEHLNRTQRESGFIELLRVASNLIIIGVPCGGKAAKWESFLDRYHRKRFGNPNKWLVEHRENVLPESTDLFNLFQRFIPASEIAVLGNVPLIFWFLLEAMEITFPRNYFRRLTTGWGVRLISRINSKNSYRQIFFLITTQV